MRLLELGYSPEKVLKELKESDAWSEYRQIGIVDKNGSSAVFTGEKNLDWKGAVAKPNFVAMGNYLVHDKVVDAMVSAFESSAENILEERLMLSIEAGRNAGGERGGHLSSALVVFGRDITPAPICGSTCSRNTPSGATPLTNCRRVFNEYKPLSAITKCGLRTRRSRPGVSG